MQCKHRVCRQSIVSVSTPLPARYCGVTAIRLSPQTTVSVDVDVSVNKCTSTPTADARNTRSLSVTQAPTHTLTLLSMVGRKGRISPLQSGQSVGVHCNYPSRQHH